MAEGQQQLDPKFLPFIRSDRYGEGGLFISFWARVRLAILACTLLPLRLITSLACVAAYYLTCRLVVLIPHDLAARRIVTAFGKLWSRACLFCLGFVWIKWTRLGDSKQPRPAKRRSVAVVSNHTSWADILIHMSSSFPAFVARDGTQNLPMIGLISQRMQCIYVDREKKGGNGSSGNGNGSSGNGSSGNGNGSSGGNSGSKAASAADGAAAAAGAVPEQLGVSGQVRARMLSTQQHPELELRPMLLFPEGTTTNGRFLLPFKTGAFLAGAPVQPTLIHYRTGGPASAASTTCSARSSAAADAAAAAAAARRWRRPLLAAAGVAAAAAAAAQLAASAGCGVPGIAAVAAAAAAAGAVVAWGALTGTGGVSPCWESIDAKRHLLLMLCQPFHTVECFELPLYQPSPEEQADPRLYASNVRLYMLKYSAAAMGPAALQPSDGLLEDKRRYQAWLRSRRQQVEQGQGLTAAIFDGPLQQQQQQGHSQAAAAAAAAGTAAPNGKSSGGAAAAAAAASNWGSTAGAAT